MPTVCPECSTSNPEEARFCLSCGGRLPVPKAEVPEDHLEPYLPRGMLAKLEAARVGRSMQGERRVVTMLFCDVKGSTAIAETLDPEEWAEIMNGTFERLIAPVYRYEGTLARLMGDAIFAFFGAPIAHEDDPVRAVAAGLDIVAAVAAYRERVAAERGQDLDVRVGINTGEVVVGQVGSDLRLEYTAMGDAVNVAARMEQTAEPGTVQITAGTAGLVAHGFDLEARGPVPVKGKAEPVPAFRVLRRKAGPQPTRALRDHRAPLVGRGRELGLLRGAVQDVLGGRGRIVCLIGDAGLGKSRLIEEVQREWARRRPEDQDRRGARDVRRIWETWQCVSYDATRPYAQYRRMLAAVAGIGDTDAPDVVRDKLVATIDFSAEWVEPHLRVWRSLFGVPEPGEQPLQGEAFRRALMELVPASTRHAGFEPRLLVFEDLHWCDEASMDLLIEIARLVEELPCLFLFSFRPDRAAPSWRLKQWLETEYPHRSVELWLSPLGPADSGALIDQLLPGREQAVRAQILRRTEGNPLFVEELAAAVAERGPGAGDELAIPATLQALITARVDTLDEPTRRILQLASVIGRSFPEPVLRAVADDPDLPTHLRTLERTGLIAETSGAPERGYAFHHSLTQESTYGTILLRTRRALHRRVGEVFEQRYADRIEESAPLLARHFQEAGEDERTLRYSTIAGDHAARLYANADAVTHYANAIEAAGRLDRTEEPLHHLFPSRGRALELSGRYDEAVANDRAWRALAEQAGDRSTVLAADLMLATLHSTPTPKFDAERGRELSERTLDLARELGDRGAESKALWNLMILNVFLGGDLPEAVHAGERSLAIAREMGAREQMAFTLNDLWRPYAAVGDLAASLASLEEATPIWRELANLPMLSENLASLASLRRLAGEDAQALSLAEEACRISEEIGNPWGQSYALMNAYGISWDRGQVGEAMSAMRECVVLAERASFGLPQATTRADLASLHANLGDAERARELIDVALGVADERQPIAHPRVMAAKAEVHLLSGDLAAAEAAAEQSELELLPESIQVALIRARVAGAGDDQVRAAEMASEIVAGLRRVSVRRFMDEALLLLGTSLRKRGDWETAETTLRDARSEAEGLGHRRVLWEILRELSDVREAREDPDEASRLRAEAGRIVLEIAGTIEDEPLRTGFLARPELEAVLAAG